MAAPSVLAGALSSIEFIAVLNPHHLPIDSECVHQPYQSGGVEAEDPIEKLQVVLGQRGKGYAAFP